MVLCWRQAGMVRSAAPCLCWWFGVTLLRMWCVFGGILRAALQVVDYIAAALPRPRARARLRACERMCSAACGSPGLSHNLIGSLFQ